MEDANMNNGAGKTSSIQFTSHNTGDAGPSNRPHFLSSAHAATRSPIAHGCSEESPAQWRNIPALPSVEDDRGDDAGVEKAENSQDVLSLSMDCWLACQLGYS
jgi:hypothetical protein